MEDVFITNDILNRLGFKDGKLGDIKIGYDGEDFMYQRMTVVIGDSFIKIKYLHELLDILNSVNNSKCRK